MNTIIMLVVIMIMMIILMSMLMIVIIFITIIKLGVVCDGLVGLLVLPEHQFPCLLHILLRIVMINHFENYYD